MAAAQPRPAGDGASALGGTSGHSEADLPVLHGGDLVRFGQKLEAITLELIQEAAEDGDFRDVANALRVGLQTHERLLKAYAARPPEFDPLRDATIVALRDLVAAALDDEPSARVKVMAAFRKVGGGEAPAE
jgi:hypothetical protein